MKQFFIWLVGFILLTACQEDVIQESKSVSNDSFGIELQEGMQRVVLNSREEIQSLIDQLGDPTQPGSRSVVSADVLMSQNEEIFVSLVEANRRKVMESLTPEQLSEIENDPEGLEFDPTDSIIADINFAQLLDAKRQIQIGDTVFQYNDKGVGYINYRKASELENLDAMTQDLQPGIEQDMAVKLENGVIFKPFNYRVVKSEDAFILADSYGGYIPEPENLTLEMTDNGMELNNGVVIPNNNIRIVEYTGDGDWKGDGNWFHKFRTGLVGENVVAIKHFSDRKKLTMSFYDQNYLIYSYIGTKLKMQKRVMGIWWNIKAQAMVQGWDLVSIKYTHPGHSIKTFGKQYKGETSLPSSTFAPSKVDNKNILLFTIPFDDFNLPFKNKDVKLSDLSKQIKKLVNNRIKAASKEEKKKINEELERAGLMSFRNNHLYVLYGPKCKSARNKRSVETKFYSKWFPGEWTFGYTFGKSNDLGDYLEMLVENISLNDGVELHAGVVYGAIKYDGKWLGAIIRKNPKSE